MAVLYNEHDPFAAAWLRELIADNLIAPGVVDERSIEDITPDELRPFRQCHFFAGVGVWSLAARLAGIPDDAPLWSGSCPCQPFSSAGKGEGFDDERHLWPAFHYLIEQCRPPLVVGEQVAGKDGDAWFDLVSADLDATGYGFGAAETCAAGFGAPHKRQRNYWVAVRLADGERARLEGLGGHGDDRDQSGRIGALPPGSVAARGGAGGLAARTSVGRLRRRTGETSAQSGAIKRPQRLCDARELDNAERDGRGAGRHDHGGDDRHEPHATGGHGAGRVDDSASPRLIATREREPRQVEAYRGIGGGLFSVGRDGGSDTRPGPVNGLWADADWIFCRDEKWRPVMPGSFPLADGWAVRGRLGDCGRESADQIKARIKNGPFYNRTGLLRGAGNAVTLAQAEEFMRAVRSSLAVLR